MSQRSPRLHGEAQPTPLTPVATVPDWWRAFAQDQCDVADYGGATVSPSTETVTVPVEPKSVPIVEVKPIAKDKSVAKVKPVGSGGATVVDYGGAKPTLLTPVAAVTLPVAASPDLSRRGPRDHGRECTV